MDTLFASGKLASTAFSTLRGRRHTDGDDAAVVLRAGFENADLTPFIRAWLDGARAVPVVFTDAGADKLAGVLVFNGPLLDKTEPLDETVLAAVRSIESTSLRGRKGDVLIECSAAPVEMVRLRLRPLVR